MKKLALMLGMACLFMVACNNAPKKGATEATAAEQTEAVEEKHECPMGQLMDEYAKWDEMDDAAKAELNAKAVAMFAEMDAKMAEMKEEGKECQKEMAEMTEEQKAECEAKCAEMKAKCEEMKAAWENIANLSADEQKDLIMQRFDGMKQCHHGEKDCCKGEEGHKCEHAE